MDLTLPLPPHLQLGDALKDNANFTKGGGGGAYTRGDIGGDVGGHSTAHLSPHHEPNSPSPSPSHTHHKPAFNRSFKPLQVTTKPRSVLAARHRDFGPTGGVSVTSRVTKHETSRMTRYEASRMTRYEASRMTRYEASCMTRYEASRMTRYEASRMTRYEASCMTRYEASRMTRYEASRMTKYVIMPYQATDSSPDTKHCIYFLITSHRACGSGRNLWKNAVTAVNCFLCAFYLYRVTHNDLPTFYIISPKDYWLC